jgi:hypothetical protein
MLRLETIPVDATFVQVCAASVFHFGVSLCEMDIHGAWLPTPFVRVPSQSDIFLTSAAR